MAGRGGEGGGQSQVSRVRRLEAQRMIGHKKGGWSAERFGGADGDPLHRPPRVGRNCFSQAGVWPLLLLYGGEREGLGPEELKW